MKVETALKWMEGFSQKIQEKKDYLSELDTPIGDGDHGGNMARGLQAVIETLQAGDYTSAADVFKAVSMQLLSKVGGASGPLYGSAFMGLTKAQQEEKNLVESLEAALAMIQKRGKAVQGEKTMVDVWAPFIADVKAKTADQEKLWSYVDATKDIQATKGRASYVGERSIGHIDPGSYSSGLLFEALLETGELYD